MGAGPAEAEAGTPWRELTGDFPHHGPVSRQDGRLSQAQHTVGLQHKGALTPVIALVTLEKGRSHAEPRCGSPVPLSVRGRRLSLGEEVAGGVQGAPGVGELSHSGWHDREAGFLEPAHTPGSPGPAHPTCTFAPS